MQGLGLGLVVTSCKTTPLPAPDAKDTCFSRSEKQIDHHMFSDRFLSMPRQYLEYIHPEIRKDIQLGGMGGKGL